MGRLSPRVLAAVFLAGCALTKPIELETLPRYQAPPLPDLIHTEPVGVVAGDVVPFDGWVIKETDWQRTKDELRGTRDALAAAYREIDRITWAAQRVDYEKTEALKACLKDKPQTLAAGAALGFSVCAGAGWAIEANRD